VKLHDEDDRREPERRHDERPDDERRVERDAVVEASPAEVWEALTDEDRLQEWIAPEVELDPVEGGDLLVRDRDGERPGTVETVEEEERFAFTWERPGQGESLVEFTIEAVPGGTRVTVVETATMPIAAGPTALASIADWGPPLTRLGRALSLVLA
jgi:uncharacterized protein YndB with AHSA1/START domain